jgi:hypothetical protein
MNAKNLIVPMLMLLSVNGYSQDCEKVIQENKKLKTKLASLIDTTQNVRIKSFDPDFKVEVSSVIGHREQQTVDITFVIVHNKVHQEVLLQSQNIQAYDDQGNAYDARQIKIGTRESSFVSEKIPTSVPVKSTVTMRRILPALDTIKKLIINVGYKDLDGNTSHRYSSLEFDNLKIDWK